MALLIGIDIGTTSTIGILVDSEGSMLALADQPTELFCDRPGWAEQDPEQWWRNTCTVIGALLRQSGRAGGEIAAVGVTGMLPAVVLLDANDRLLRRSIQQSDGRTGREVEELAAEVDPGAFVQRTGNGINQQLVAAKLRWLREARAAGVPPHRDRLRLVRLHQLAAHRRKDARAQLGARSRLRRRAQRPDRA